MSLEDKIAELTTAIINLNNVIVTLPDHIKVTPENTIDVQNSIPAPVVIASSPDVMKAQDIVGIPDVQPIAPPVFVFNEPAPVVQAAPVQQSAPFTDITGLQNYLIEAYKTLGPEKGSKIQGVVTALGCNGINEIKVEDYPVVFKQVEALKNG